MSFDLLVFDPLRVPNEDNDMRAWYDALVKWDHPDSNVTLAQTTPALRNFCKLLAQDFPPMTPNQNFAGKPASITDRLMHLFSGKKTTDPRFADDFDEAYLTDYSIAKDAIFLCFAWSVSDDAKRTVLDAAAKSRVGFWNVSEKNSHPLRLPQQIKDLRGQLGDVPKVALTNAELFKMLKDDGWKVRRDRDDSSRSATLTTGETILRVFPSVRRSTKGVVIDWGEQAIPKVYLKAVCEIQGEKVDFYPLTLGRGTRQDAPDITLSTAKAELDEITCRLLQQDLQAALEETASLPFSTPGNAAIRLLSAKACLGEFSELSDIRDRMKKGERQGFVPYIQVEHLERAVKACAQIGNFP